MKLTAGNKVILLLGYLTFAVATLATGAKKSNPSPLHTNPPTFVPTKKPTPQPSKSPAYVPTKKPTVQPSKPPTFVPTKKPTAQPSKPPTSVPIQKPTRQPSKPPMFAPSAKPTLRQPSKPPTLAPTLPPTPPPSRPPTLAPTIKPTTSPPTTAPHGGAVFVQLTPPSLAPFPPPSFPPTVAPPSFAPVVPPTLAPVVPPTFVPVVTPTFAPVVTPTFSPSALNTNNNNCYTAQAIPSAVITITPFETASLNGTGAPYNACGLVHGNFPTKWFTYLAPTSCISITASSSSYIYPVVYGGVCDSTVCVSGVTYSGNSMSWANQAYTTYLIAAGAIPNSGEYALTITCELPTSNDSCEAALPVVQGITLFETASLRFFESAKWYTLVPPVGFTSSVLVSVLPVASNSTGYGIVVYEGSCASLTNVAGVDGGDSYSWTATLGTTYLIAVFVYANSGDYELSITLEGLG